MENPYKVKLRSQLTNILVTFDVVPDINETRNVEYKSFNPIHGPGTIYTYAYTPSRVFNINNARLVSRTPKEASLNLVRLQILRSWTLPYFGQTQIPYLGLPPDVLSFYAFSRGPSVQENKNGDGNERNLVAPDTINNLRPTHLYNIPVVVNNLQITYPSDVDYIPTEEATFNLGRDQTTFEVSAGEPFPTVMSVDLVMQESQAPSDFNRFDLNAYRAGRLEGF